MTTTRTLIWALMLSATLTAPGYASFTLGGNTENLTSTIGKTLGLTESNSTLISQVTKQLPVSGQQATGGVGALLSLAQNQLSDENNTELNQLVPGIEHLSDLNQSGIQNGLSEINDMNAVTSTFKQLGLSPDMVSQFVPLILKYLTTQGASDGLLSSLTSLWQS
ncbi:DUF2780 domain-containing protein [Vibrio mangrovi]|uniref:DUF2780 domain-containing protein n=1 Tax=Vibrio mangrovi TaxID=474394 RepID=A0A1Y6IZ51_9VIBR|nr:DUF2780 domain-containing protein [Vibrio mangrovi]MDW6002810.1 DUF2780 domain-containing protein [Vibrio mangrovi]SMS02301.1 hypothetical protein VIM7927_03621 [Vibrio mangrovi]